jgi:predicted dehydrogenase
MSAPLSEHVPDRLRRVPVSEHDRHHQEKYRHPLRKLRLFAFRDGLRETVRKARSKLVERRIEAAQEILVCGWGDGDGGRRIGVTRDLGGVPRFHAELVFAAPDGLTVDDVRLGEDVVARMEAYLPVPECPLAGEVAELLRAANPELGELAVGAGGGGVTVAGGAGGAGVSPVASARGAAPRPAGRVFLLGYGGYVREQVLPMFRREVAGAVDHKAELLREHGAGAGGAGGADGFRLVREMDELLPDIAAAERPLVVIATYHSNHVDSALAVLDANPAARVFIEKPAAVTVAEAESLAARRAAGAWIDIGFNRRHAAMTGSLVEAASRLPRPLVFSALVKELKIPASHWYLWPNQGTRVTGNLCHWIDLAHLLTGSECVDVQALGGDDTVSATLAFDDGSIATLVATDAGDDLGGVMELLELRGGGTTLVVDDYRRLVRLEDGRRTVRRSRREKGHRRMYEDLRRRWREGLGPAYPAVDIVAVARTTARVVEAVGAGAGPGGPGGPAGAGARGG